MDADFYITDRSSKFPIDHARSSEEAAALLMRHRDRYPDAIAEPTADYFERSRAETLASFPLSRITQRFYDAMLNALPPQYVRGATGFFLSEPATQRIHAQFIDMAAASTAAMQTWRANPARSGRSGTSSLSKPRPTSTPCRSTGFLPIDRRNGRDGKDRRRLS